MSGKRVSEMTDAEIRKMAGVAPGVVKVRLSGSAADVAAVAAVIASGARVLERSAAYANRRDPGERVYLTVQIGSVR